MAQSGDNCKSKRSPVSIAGFSPFQEFMMETSDKTNPKCLSKSSSAYPQFSEGIGTCWYELVWKHCEISICLSNTCIAFNESILSQARQSRDCNSWIKLTSYSSHNISRTTFLGGNTPEGHSLPCQAISPKPLHFSTPGYILRFGNIISRTSLRWHTALVSPFSGTEWLIDRNMHQDWLDRAKEGSFATCMNQASRICSQDSIYFVAVPGCMNKPGSGNM